MAKKKGKASRKASAAWNMNTLKKGKEGAEELYEKLKKEAPKAAGKAKTAAAKSKSAKHAKASGRAALRAAKAAKKASAKHAKASGRAALRAAKALPGPAKIAGIAAVGLGTYIAGRRSGKKAGSKVNIGNAAIKMRGGGMVKKTGVRKKRGK